MMNLNIKNFATFGNGVCIVNTTPHMCTFQDTDGSLKVVDPCGYILNAQSSEMPVNDLYIKIIFTGTEEGEELLAAIEKMAASKVDPPLRLVIVGSMIAAQAYPGKVAAMCPVPGFERVPPAEKRMRCDKFTIF